MNNEKSFGLNIFTSAIPRSAMTLTSLPKMYTNPARINTSAMSAVELSFARSRTRTKGRKATTWRRIKCCTGTSLRQFVTPRINA